MAKYKKIFIPGWMDTVKNRVDFEGIDIWMKESINQKIDSEYAIGHCAGANCALLNWQENKNLKLILINPCLPKRSIFIWAMRIIKFWIFEGTEMSKKRLKCYKYTIASFIKVIKLLKMDLMPIISEIPKDNIMIIRGENDNFFFDKKISDDLKGQGINIIEIKNIGHNWNDKIEEEINKIIK